jgi:hypothetical protein
MADIKPIVAGIRYDPTVNLGHIMTLIGMIVAVLGVYVLQETRSATQDLRIVAVEKAVVTVPTLQEIARANEKAILRLEAADERATESNRRIYDRLNLIAEDLAIIKGQVGGPR